jgi:hypothetical protein
MPKANFTLAQVQEQRDLRIQAGAIRSTIDESDPVNYILTTEWNVIGGTEAPPAATTNAGTDSGPTAHGTGHAMAAGLASETNVMNLATLLMSEASIGNDTERAAVGFTVLNRMTNGNRTNVDQVWNAYAHNQSPTSPLIALARQLLGGLRTDITEGSTHFYSPRSMPKEGQSTGGFDVAGGLELVDGMTVRSFAPSWAKTMRYVQIAGVRPAFYKFYTST